MVRIRKKTITKRSELASERRVQAVTLRKAGMTYDQIGEQLGISGVAAWKTVTVALDKTLREPAKELRELEVQRLETMLRGVWPKAIAGEVHSVDRAVKISERMAKLLGLDAPIRSEITGAGGGPIASASIDVKIDMTKSLTDPERLKEVIGLIRGLGLQGHFPELTPLAAAPAPEIPAAAPPPEGGP